MNPRCEAFLALSLLSALFLVPTGDAGMAASAALTAIDVLSDARAPIVDSADWRPVQSDKSQRAERSAKHDVAASPPSAPADTHAASVTLSDAKRKLLPANVSPQVATQGSVDVSAGSGLTSSAGDASRGRGICVCGLDTEGQDFCFQDSACEQLTACMSSTDCGPGERCLAHNCCPPPANFACFAICAGGCVGGGECGSYQAGTPPPPNDDCVFAEDATVPSQLTASTVGATFDAAPFCFTSNTAPGVWYRVIGTGNTMRASMCTEFVDPGYDPKLSVYCGGCDVLTCVAGNDDGFCPGLPQFPSDVSWCSIAGAEYLVLVHGWQNTTGRALLDFSDDGNPFCDGRVSCLAGDDCDDASAIPSVPFTTTFDNSTALPGSPPGSCNSGAATAMDNDVWYTYTARNDCELSVNVNPGIGAGYDGLAVVYKGPDCLSLTEIVCLDDPEIGSVSVTAGMTYWVQIGDWGLSPGGGLTTLDVDCRPASACCIQGDCVDGLSSTNCQEQGGTWFDGVGCADFVCPEACCLSNLDCEDMTPGVCRANYGIPRGPGTDCDTNPCPQLPQACCFADVTCQAVLAGSCTAACLCNPDMNCDSELNASDIDPFILAMTDRVTYQNSFPFCDLDWADVDCDGDIDELDWHAFQCLLGIGGPPECMNIDALSCTSHGGTSVGPDTVCSNTQEACCSLSNGACLNRDPVCCGAAQGAAQGPGTACGDLAAACCFTDGSCSALAPQCCDDLGGIPSPIGELVCLQDSNGDGTDDACENPPPPTGACCNRANFVCNDNVLQINCVGIQQTWHQDSPCTDPSVSCVPPLLACCLADGDCRDTTAADCQTAGGFPQGSGSSCDNEICIPVSCDQSPHPVCGGVCPSGERCVTVLVTGVCVCEPVPCDETFPVCGGACPVGSVCTSVPGAIICSCQPIECAPNAEGTACNGALCLNQGECNARCVNFDPTTGARSIVDCECRDAGECHVAPVGPARGVNPCTVADDGSGTVTLPPQGCAYLSPDEVHEIIDGLPAGTTIELAAIHKDFICDRQNDLCSMLLPPGECEGPGGSLGSHGDCFESTLDLTINGTGGLAGFNRSLSIPIFCEVHTGPRNPGDAVQTFPNDMFRLYGELFGDPDFCTFKVTGGRGFGLPSPGQTTLTKLPSGDFNVDSFFDITYQIEFTGCPGTQLEGLSGVTTATIRMQTGEGIEPPTCIGACPPNTECRRSTTANADGTITVCCDCVTPEPPAACCLPNGECVDVTPGSCEDLGGVSKGPGTACEGDADGNGVDDACEDDPCEDCGPDPHWVDQCVAGVDSMPSGALVGLDLGPEFDCIPDINLVLHGPVHIARTGPMDDSVNFPGTSPIDGHPTGPGLDVIDTEMLQLTLTGGGVTLTAGAGQGVGGVLPASLGAIVEQPAMPDWADSFFEVFFEVNNGGVLAYNHTPLRINSKINCLPPDATYIHPIGCIPLYDTPPGIDGQVVAQLVTANHSTYPACGDPGTGSCTDPHDSPFCRDERCCSLVCEQLSHCCADQWDVQCVQAALEICRGFVETDEFELSIGLFELHHPSGNVEIIPVSGPATVKVYFEGPNEGDADDDDGNNRDDVRTEMVDLQLSGFSPKLGPIHVTVNPALPSLGVIEELVDNNTGLLDVDPFAPGDAESYFDIFFKIDIGGIEYFTIAPKRMSGVIGEKPPDAMTIYQNLQRFELYDANGRPTGFFIGAARHRPRPTIEVDEFDFSIGQFDLAFPNGSIKRIPVAGPATVHVYFEGPNEGDADDSDGDSRDDVVTEMVALNLVGYHPDLGVVTVGVHPMIPSLGQIEELVDNNTGLLDVDPFAPGDADSYFDLFFEIHVGGVRYFTHHPKRMSSVIEDKPPGPAALYENLQDVELYDEDGVPTGIILTAARHRPNPLVSTSPPHCAIDARQPHPVGPNDNQVCGLPKFGWDSLTMQFNADPTILNLQPSDFAVEMVPPGVGTAPVITNVVSDAASQTVHVHFNRPIDPGHWTCVVYTASGRRWCLGYLPADAGQDRLSAASDVTALINSINLVPGFSLPPHATDINRSGVTTGSDILRLIDLLNGAQCFDPWITRTLRECPASDPGMPD